MISQSTFVSPCPLRIECMIVQPTFARVAVGPAVASLHVVMRGRRPLVILRLYWAVVGVVGVEYITDITEQSRRLLSRFIGEISAAIHTEIYDMQ